MHITRKPAATIERDNEQQDFNILSKRVLVASTTNPFDAVRAAITIQQRVDYQQLQSL